MKDYLADDSVDVYSNGAISRAKVVDTNHDDGLYRVKIEAEEGRGYCPTNLD